MVRSNASRWSGVGISLPPYRMRSPACRQHLMLCSFSVRSQAMRAASHCDTMLAQHLVRTAPDLEILKKNNK